jgi:hypothetical protein
MLLNSRTEVLKVLSLGHQHHQGTCQNCTLTDPALELVNQSSGPEMWKLSGDSDAQANVRMT